MVLEIERVTEQLALGEGPHWDVKSRKLYFVDILKSTIHCYDPETKNHVSALVDSGKKPVSLIVPIESEKNQFLITYGCDIAKISWDGTSKTVNDVKTLCTVDDRFPKVRINDGKCSPSGVLFVGTMEADFQVDTCVLSGDCSLYALQGKQTKTVVKDVILSNGLAWTQDEKRFYYIDSLLFRIDGFDYNSESHEFVNRRTVFDFKMNNITGVPDGMTMDTNGNLWVAVFEGNQVLNIDPKNGKILQSIRIPTSRVTSVVFGGLNLDELYVTTAKLASLVDNTPVTDDTNAGCVFKVKGLSKRGFPSAAATL